MPLRWFRRRAKNPLPHCQSAPAGCAGLCSLAACRTGNTAMVVRVACPAADACRLRALGVYEGARVQVVDSRNGLLLDVRGSRLALGTTLAAAISVLPVSV